MRKVAIVAGGEAKAGKRKASWRDLVQEAGKALFEDVDNLSPKDVDSIFVGAAQPERFAFLSYVAPLVAEYIGVTPRKVVARTELACVSGQAAIRYGWNCVATGMSDIAVAIGVEKMYPPDMAEAQSTMACVLDREWDGVNCFSAPPIFAVTAQRHMYEFGTTKEQMALVSVKNHHYSSLNPVAHLRKEVTVEAVLNSPVVAPPLNLFDCCPMTDGSAGVILVAAEDAKKYTDTPMYLVGSGQCAIGNVINNLASLTEWVPLKLAAEEAWRTAKIMKDDVDIAEVHDCFTISEIMEYEGLGFCEKGKGGKFIEDGEPYIGGKVAVNPSGGIMGCGHPLGATSIYHAFEILKQFRGDVDRGRHVKGAEIGIQHSLSGAANQHSILVCSREPR